MNLKQYFYFIPIAIIFIIFMFFSSIINFYVDWLWFNSVNYFNVFWIIFSTKVGLFFLFLFHRWPRSSPPESVLA